MSHKTAAFQPSAVSWMCVFRVWLAVNLVYCCWNKLYILYGLGNVSFWWCSRWLHIHINLFTWTAGVNNMLCVLLIAKTIVFEYSDWFRGQLVDQCVIIILAAAFIATTETSSQRPLSVDLWHARKRMAAPIQKQRSIGEKIDFDDALDPRIQV